MNDNITQIMPAAEGWRAELYTIEDGELGEYIVEPVIGWALVEDDRGTYIEAAILLDPDAGAVELFGNVAANVRNMSTGNILRPGDPEDPERARTRVQEWAAIRAGRYPAGVFGKENAR
jgi:hypothetical protein